MARKRRLTGEAALNAAYGKSDHTPLLAAWGVDLPDDLLCLALTHRSFANENGNLPNNERLEFLGDAVLGLAVAEQLYRQFPDRHAILLALMERSAQRLHDQADRLKDRPDAFFALLEYLSARIVGSPALSDYWRTAKLDDPRVNALRQRVWSAFGPALERGKQSGLIRTDIQAQDISLLSSMLGAALRGNTDAERRRLARQALGIVRRGLQPDADTAASPAASTAVSAA